MTPTLHFISGWAVPASAWDDVFRPIGTTCHVIVHNATEWSADTPLDTDGPVYLGGWSLGAQLALETALRNPTPCRGLLLISATARFCRGPGQRWGARERVLDAMADKLESSPRQVLHDFYARCAYPSASDEYQSAAWADQVLSNGHEGLVRGLHHLRDTDLRDQFDGFEHPTALLHGREDRIVPADASVWLERRLAGASCRIIEGAGHDLPLRRPDLAVETLHHLLEVST